MKKFFVILASILIAFATSSCKCTSDVEEPINGVSASVENLVSLDRQDMFQYYGEDYRWFETGVVLKDWLDEENDGSIEMVVNVFQMVEVRDSSSFDTFVVKYQHVGEDVYQECVRGFWVEDFPLNDENVKVTFKEAYEKIMAVNLPKPHTKQVVLRKQVGPNPCNPQWVFGNIKSQIYVDAVTGEVSDVNPAFPEFNLASIW